jgi:glyoxylase-like metal-dependent hydrolase (beta-lactamase superfamily II)
MANWEYTKGLHELGDRCFAYLQPDGSWGWSNAGLIQGDGGSLLVDTLFDLRLTGEMLDAMKAVTSGAPIGTLVNTHSNGDHCWGNELVEGAEIIASKACADEMGELEPAVLGAFVDAGAEAGAVGSFMQACFGAFKFDDITLTPPTKTFEGRLNVDVAGTAVELIEVGPAHTRGDVLAYVPGEKTMFTGDILFIDGTPIVWAGPFENWINACDLILGLDLETIVPGHGPITDKKGVAAVRDYLAYVEVEATKRHEAGMTVEEAARDIALGQFTTWGEKERIAVNVDTIYRQLSGSTGGPDVAHLFSLMAEMNAA